MSCCGNSRQQIAFPAGASPTGAKPAAERRFEIRFEYLGATALTVIGPVSGRQYRFAARGARIAIDPRDRRSLARIPGLREVA